MSNTSSPNTTPGEYTRGTGFTFPNQPTIAQSTAEATTSSAATSGATVGTTFPMNPATGQLAYNTTLGHLYVFNGVTWVLA